MMLHDLKFLRRKPPPPPPEAENLHHCPPPAFSSDPARPPLAAIQPPRFRTPEKPPPPPAARSKFGRAPPPAAATDDLPPPPRLHRNGGGRSSSLQSDTSPTHSTPTRSVNKPPLGLGPRTACFSAELLHFELPEDPSFWLDHNVQVVIRIRPLDSTERSLQGYSRCLKQESARCVSWIGQPDARFTFDYVASETIKQEMLFRVIGLPMVENCMAGYNCCMFAYGQTGSGKTYTMLGEIDELEMKPSVDWGMTPRIFEFLFARIRTEEESRRDEKLKYSCKCSFLEIYNEQITDLLDPSSTNLLLREDPRKGVYVENLSEFGVETVNDILKLLMQGAANRKVAATNMNRESSRSHSVFTCVIESRQEKGSTVNLRFARLNLVDLAGSEGQKISGAEGDRLKEVASINKSLSTLGHVITILADVAHGKQRHIPYRDSRLTCLLQDSLGGNSKTVIMANVTPSVCSANETLSTLKFAQRARFIQNNAVVNEDTSGDLIALQHQIRILKVELSAYKRQNTPRPLSSGSSVSDDSEMESLEVPASKRLRGRLHMNGDEFQENEASCSVRVSTKQEELMALQQQASVSNQNMLLVKNRLSAIEIENKELHERLSLVTKDNETLSELLEEKEAKLRSLTEDWESFASEIVDVLANGCTSLEDASDQIFSISYSAPQRIWISEKVGRMMRNISERDALIEEIRKCLEDAQNVKRDMELKLRYLRGAMMAITEAQQQETCEKDGIILLLRSQLSERDAAITEMQNRIDRDQEQQSRVG